MKLIIKFLFTVTAFYWTDFSSKCRFVALTEFNSTCINYVVCTSLFATLEKCGSCQSNNNFLFGKKVARIHREDMHTIKKYLYLICNINW